MPNYRAAWTPLNPLQTAHNASYIDQHLSNEFEPRSEAVQLSRRISCSSSITYPLMTFAWIDITARKTGRWPNPVGLNNSHQNDRLKASGLWTDTDSDSPRNAPRSRIIRLPDIFRERIPVHRNLVRDFSSSRLPLGEPPHGFQLLAAGLVVDYIFACLVLSTPAGHAGEGKRGAPRAPYPP